MHTICHFPLLKDEQSNTAKNVSPSNAFGAQASTPENHRHLKYMINVGRQLYKFSRVEFHAFLFQTSKAFVKLKDDYFINLSDVVL